MCVRTNWRPQCDLEAAYFYDRDETSVEASARRAAERRRLEDAAAERRTRAKLQHEERELIAYDNAVDRHEELEREAARADWALCLPKVQAALAASRRAAVDEVATWLSAHIRSGDAESFLVLKDVHQAAARAGVEVGKKQLSIRLQNKHPGLFHPHKTIAGVTHTSVFMGLVFEM